MVEDDGYERPNEMRAEPASASGHRPPDAGETRDQAKRPARGEKREPGSVMKLDELGELGELGELDGLDELGTGRTNPAQSSKLAQLPWLPPAAHFETELGQVDRLIGEIEAEEEYPGRERFLNHLRGRRDVLEFYREWQRRSGGGAG